MSDIEPAGDRARGGPKPAHPPRPDRLRASPKLRALAALAALATLAAPGCSVQKQAAPVNPPKIDSSMPMRTERDALEVFEQAEGELRGRLTVHSGLNEPQPTVDPGHVPAPGPMANTDGDLTLAERCALACRALASMRRAVERLCELTGESDARCEDVRARVASAERMVKAACPDCAESG